MVQTSVVSLPLMASHCREMQGMCEDGSLLLLLQWPAHAGLMQGMQCKGGPNQLAIGGVALQGGAWDV